MAPFCPIWGRLWAHLTPFSGHFDLILARFLVVPGHTDHARWRHLGDWEGLGDSSGRGPDERSEEGLRPRRCRSEFLTPHASDLGERELGMRLAEPAWLGLMVLALLPWLWGRRRPRVGWPSLDGFGV